MFQEGLFKGKNILVAACGCRSGGASVTAPDVHSNADRAGRSA
jgi:hypothetical protein